ncbi:MAG: hypothetical protein V1804_02285 [Patescibacteria group bacterium]
MDANKLLEVIKIYRDYFKENEIPAMDFSETKNAPNPAEALAHCHGMLAKMEEFIKEGRIEKVHRWLGFVQGCLWMIGDFNLEDLRNHNRPKE